MSTATKPIRMADVMNLKKWRKLDTKWRNSYEGAKRYAIVTAAHGRFHGSKTSTLEKKKEIVNQYEKGKKIMKKNNSKNQPQTVSDLYQSPWLYPDDLNGKSCVLTITAVRFDEFPEKPRDFNGDKVTKAILNFGRTKELILNKTQCLAIATILDTEKFADWAGQKITLSPGISQNGKPTILIAPAPETK